MEINSKQASHHLPCLSGLSQAPLIAPGDDNGTDRFTTISAHSLSHNSPIANHSTSSNNLSFNNSRKHNRQNQPVGTPLPPSAQSIVFFPPPARLNRNQQAQFGAGSIKNQTNDRSPQSADINMNVEGQRNRETHSHSTNISPSHAARNLDSNSSKLNSPLIPPSKTFPELKQQDSFNFNRHRRTPLVASPTCLSLNNNNLPPQDENYHLYHEPDLPDEPSPSSLVSLSPINMRGNTPIHISQSPAPPPIKPNNKAATSINNAINSNTTSTNTFVVPSTPTSTNSPTISTNESNAIPRHQSTSSTFSNRPGSARRNDVSADIYLCYVSLKSTERANHRSRSYHGPKNTNGPVQTQQTLYAKDAHKNLSSTSVAESPLSPAAFASMIPVHFRDHCVRELIETESNYVHALDMILTSFAKPLEPQLKRDDNQLIFGHIKHFHHIHSGFQQDLVQAAMRSYTKDMAFLSSPTHNTVAHSRNQTNSNPSTPPAINGLSRQILNASPLSSPIQDQVPISPPLSATCKTNGGCSLKISSCFLNIKEKFLKYGEYCATLSKAQALLDELTNKNEALAAQLDRCQHEANEGKFKLRDLLSLPMQRILKYHLLLAQLIKNTSSSNEDYNGLKRAHEAMVDLGQYINEVKRDTEAIQIINNIEQQITGLNMPPNTQLTDYGRLVIDGSIRIKVPHDFKSKQMHDTKIKLPHDNKLKQKRYVFVFDKVMLMCKEGVRGYQYKEALVLSEFDIEVNLAPTSTDTLSRHATKDKWSYCFNLVRSSDKTTYAFYTKTLEMKNKWIESIQKAKDNIRPAACRNSETNHEFLMHTFDKASSCDHCGKLLHGLYYQGYRCRTCFSSAHKKCLSLIRPCGPALPPRTSNTITLTRVRCKEPPSPSVRSQCSDDGHMFMQFPPSNASSTLCVDAFTKNEYSNIDNRLDPSFRDHGTLPSRPVSSMINVSLQNTTNHFLQQNRHLKGSNSTPAISQRACLKARAVANYDGNEEAGQLQIQINDWILVSKNSLNQLQIDKDGLDSSLAQLRLSFTSQNGINKSPLTINESYWFGKNMRTGREGQFPSCAVEILQDQNSIQFESDCLIHEMNMMDNHEIVNGHPSGKSYVNFILNEYSWFRGRMERDQAQALLENSPHETFLVRVSPKHNGSYVISLKYYNQVKHMRIYVSRDNQLYLSQNRYFKSVIELVAWYEHNSLKESFNMFDARLAIPFGK